LKNCQEKQLWRDICLLSQGNTAQLCIARYGGNGLVEALQTLEKIYAYVTLNAGVESTEELRKELVDLVRKEIGAIANPDIIQWAPGLPKTRSGKIMRRILRKVAANELDNLGDISTLADPAVVTEIIYHRANK